MNRATLAIAVLTILTLTAAQAVAGTITYTESAVVSGSVGSTTFTDALITLSLVGDTANVTGGSGFFTNSVGTFTFNIAGVGSGSFTDAMIVFVNQLFVPPAAGFGDTTVGGSVLDTEDNVFGTYDLKTAIGPITNTPFIRPDLSFGTTLGALNIQSSGNSTFTASTVPEPASLLLLGSGALGLAGVVRRKLTT
jgi:hypothetical protein